MGISRAITDHKGFRNIWQKELTKQARNFKLTKADCTGCGARLVFDAGDAVANCAFCGRSLVKKEFVNADTIPELMIPFAITREEAMGRLEAWCKQHSLKKEARAIRKHLEDLKGCYLPYELVRGPVECEVTRVDGGRSYDCGGFVDQVFVNCSKKLDNRLLDGMEPYDLEELIPFDFAYIAGHQVKDPSGSRRGLPSGVTENHGSQGTLYEDGCIGCDGDAGSIAGVLSGL